MSHGKDEANISSTRLTSTKATPVKVGASPPPRSTSCDIGLTITTAAISPKTVNSMPDALAPCPNDSAISGRNVVRMPMANIRVKMPQ